MYYLTKIISFKDGKFSVLDNEKNEHRFDTLTEAKAFCRELFEDDCLMVLAV